MQRSLGSRKIDMRAVTVKNSQLNAKNSFETEELAFAMNA
jgi:hypothetical protein